MKQGKKKSKKELNDWLVPILLVLCVMPLVVRLAVYSCGFASYEWYALDDEIQDLYLYYRCYFFEVLMFFAGLALVLRMMIDREKTKPMRMFWPLGIYAIMIAISTIASVHVSASLQGNYYQFQTVFVLLGYLILFFYTYQIVDINGDEKTLVGGLSVISIAFGVIGLFQIAGKDLLDFDAIKKLVMSEELYAYYGDAMENVFSEHRVYLSLFNPNYAAVALCMLFAVMAIYFLSENEKKMKCFYGAILVLLLVLLWFTYSRAALITILLLAVIYVIGLMKTKQKKVLPLFASILIVGIFLTGVDAWNHFSFLSRFSEKKVEKNIENMETSEQGIVFSYKGENYRVWLEDEELRVEIKKGEKAELSQKDDYSFDQDESRFWVEDQQIYLLLDEHLFTFVKEDEQYKYLNGSNKLVQMKTVDAVDFKGYEYLGSGRLYIWSRTLPLLKKYIVWGSGPETFAEVFPQNDYLGKSYYAAVDTAVMEHPHNDYLQQWVQLGGVAMVAYVVFAVMLLVRGWKCYVIKPLGNKGLRLGCGCYYACIAYLFLSFFNDGTLFTAPFFWIFAAIVWATTEKNS